MALIDLVLEAADFCFHYQEKTTFSMVVGRQLKEQIRREQEQEVCIEPPSLLPLQGPEEGLKGEMCHVPGLYLEN